MILYNYKIFSAHVIISSDYDNNVNRQPLYIHRHFSLNIRLIHEKIGAKLKCPKGLNVAGRRVLVHKVYLFTTSY